MKVAFMASDAIALDCIKMLHAGQCPGFELSCVVSNPDKPKGRGKKMSPNDMFYAAAIGKNSEFLYKDEQVLKLIEEGVKKFPSDKRAKQVQDKIDAAKK